MESQSLRKTGSGKFVFNVLFCTSPMYNNVITSSQLKPREKAALEYADSLKQKFANHPQIKRIARHRQVPKHIYHHQQQLRASKDKLRRKLVNFITCVDTLRLYLHIVFTFQGSKSQKTFETWDSSFRRRKEESCYRRTRIMYFLCFYL